MRRLTDRQTQRRAKVYPKADAFSAARRDLVLSGIRLGRAGGLATVAALAAALLLGCTVPDGEYCATHEDCPRIVGVSDSSYVCHPTRHVCISSDPLLCFSDDDCKDLALPRCNTVSYRCEPCVLDDDMACAHNKQAPYCGSAPSGGTMCVACRRHTDCPASAPICESQHCRKCQKHSDCEGELKCDGDRRCVDSLVCINEADFGAELAGQCAMNGPNGRVVYVYHNPTKLICSDTGTRNGTDFGQPYCSPEEATQAAKAFGRTYVRVVAGGMNYAQTSVISSEHLVYIGAPVPSHGIMVPATVEARGTTFEAATNGNVTIDEFDLLELTPDTSIVKCSGTPPQQTPLFTLKNSIVRGATQLLQASATAAVDLSNCQAKVYGNIIGLASLAQIMDANSQSHSRGIRITSDSGFMGASFLIENNLIAGNWGMAVDLYNVYRKTVTFRFNTLVHNGRAMTGLGGVNCPTSSSVGVPLTNSIIFQNGPSSISQFGMPGSCSFSKVVVGPSETATFPGLIKEDPMLDGQFRLTKASSVCIDMAMPASGEVWPTSDLAGNKRPQGGGYDLGAFELPSM